MILHPRPTSRRGITLLEVLTAIFIMGVGLLALLTLFPLGALSMARAVRDDRAAAAGANASALANAFDLRNDATVSALLGGTPAGFLPPDPNGPGYPVYVDPLYRSLGSPALGSVPNVTPGVLRASPGYVTGSPSPARSMARWFTFQDEIAFEKTGQPTGDLASGGGSTNRPGTYSWAYLLRRPRSSSPAMTELSVVVYASRATDSVSGEQTINTVTAAMGTAGTTTLSFPFTGDRPNIRKGGWILDTTYRATTLNTYGTVNGHFYRVASVTDTGANSMTLELETPLKETVSTIVIMENVITVLDRGTSWKP